MITFFIRIRFANIYPLLSGHLNLFAYIFFFIVFYVPSMGRSFRDGIPIYCPLRRT